MKEFTLVLAGDTSLGDWYLQRAEPEVRERLHKDPLSFFSELAPLISDNNLFIANLETVLASNPVGPLDGKKKYLGWDDPQRTTAALQALGVHAVSLANNHTMDFGPEILAETAAHLRSAGIEYFGAGQNLENAATPLMRRIALDGVERNLYVIGALKNTIPLREEYGFFATDHSWGVNPLSAKPLCTRIRQLRESDPDALIILSPHWGQNYAWASDLMWRTSQRYVESGADLVIGHGAHMLQEFVSYDNGFVAFSIGNFVFNSRGRYDRLNAPPYSLIARLNLTPSESGITGDLRFYPIVCDNLVTNYYPRPVSKAEALAVSDELTRRSEDSRGGDFDLDSDDRGWYLKPRRLSPRIESDGQPRLSGRWFGRSVGQIHRRVGDEIDSLTGDGLRRSELPRYGPGSTQACIAQALKERNIGYTETRRAVRGQQRPALNVWLGGHRYVFSAARIYHEMDGRLKRLDSRVGRIVKRKDIVSAVLRGHGFAVPSGLVFGRNKLDEAELYFDAVRERFSHGFCVKPVNGGLGRHVYTHITDAKDFRSAFKAAGSDYDEILVEECLVGEVFRFLWVAGKVCAVRVGIPMNVVGDGVADIQELVEAKNRLRSTNPIHRHYPIVIGVEQEARLAEADMTPTFVPPAGYRVLLGRNSNLHSGADVVDRTDEIDKSYLSVVDRAVDAVPGMFVCGADVLIENPDVPATSDNYGIIELNTGPGIGSHHFPWEGQPRDVAGEIVEALREGKLPQA